TTVKGSPSPGRDFSRRDAGRVSVPRPRTWIVVVVIPKISISGFLGPAVIRQRAAGASPVVSENGETSRPVRPLSSKHAMELNREACYRAVKARDRRFDGRFLTGVASTVSSAGRFVLPGRPGSKTA